MNSKTVMSAKRWLGEARTGHGISAYFPHGKISFIPVRI